MGSVIWAALFKRAAVGVLLACVPGLPLQAAEQRYDYDPLGRLVRSVAGEQANEYLYDPAGNLLQMTSGATQPPVIGSGNLGDFRRNAFRHVAVSGSNLVGASIRSPHAEIALSNVVVSATAISFRVAVGPTAPLGAHGLIFETAAGSASVAMNVVPGMAVSFEPMPIAVPPDNQARKFTVRLSEPATEALSFSLGTSSPLIAKTTASQVSFAVGQDVADIGVIGVATGTTVLRVDSEAFLEPAEALVSVSSGSGSQIIYSARIGITRGAPWASEALSHTVSKTIGITRGVPWANVDDRITMSNPVGIARGESWLSTSDKFTASPPVGIERGTPFAKSLDTLAVTPPVGITRP